MLYFKLSVFLSLAFLISSLWVLPSSQGFFLSANSLRGASLCPALRQLCPKPGEMNTAVQAWGCAGSQGRKTKSGEWGGARMAV